MSPSPRLPRRLSTRTYLLGLVAAVLIPLVVTACVVVMTYAEAERDRYEREAQQIAQQVALVVESELRGLLALLQGLSGSSALARDDIATFRAEARRVIGNRWAVIILRDLERTLVMNTELDSLTELPPGRILPAWERERLAAGETLVSDVFANPTSGEPLIAVAMPIPRPGGPPLVLAMAVQTSRIRDVLQSAVPEGWIVGIGDRAGTFVTRSSLHEMVTGRPGLPEYLLQAQGQAGTFSSTNFEGTRLLAGYVRPEFSGWLYAANIPEDIVAAPLWHSLTIVAIAGALAVALSVGLATALGSQLAMTASGLVAQARGLGEGRVEPPRRTAIAEFAVVGDALVAAAETLHERTRELEAVLETVPAGVSFTYDPLARKVIRNRFDAALLRLAPGAAGSIAAGSPSFAHVRVLRDGVRVLPDDLPLRRAASGERVVDEEFKLEFDDGSSITILTNASPLRNESGKVVGAVAVHIEITERKRSEEQRRILVSELSHRVKNTLAMVQALASQTARSAPTLSAFKESFSARVTALAATHDLLTASDWHDVELEKIIRAELAPYVDGVRIPLDIAGPEVLIPALLVTPIGLVMHELTTNAVKHGALANERGRLVVRWRDENGDLHIEWSETASRPIERSTPGSGGFGSKLIQRIVTGQLSGTIDTRVEAESFACTIVFPLRDLRGRLAPTIGSPV